MWLSRNPRDGPVRRNEYLTLGGGVVVVGSSSLSDSHILICIAAAALKDEKKTTKNDVEARATATAVGEGGRQVGGRTARNLTIGTEHTAHTHMCWQTISGTTEHGGSAAFNGLWLVYYGGWAKRWKSVYFAANGPV